MNVIIIGKKCRIDTLRVHNNQCYILDNGGVFLMKTSIKMTFCVRIGHLVYNTKWYLRNYNQTDVTMNNSLLLSCKNCKYIFESTTSNGFHRTFVHVRVTRRVRIEKQN